MSTQEATLRTYVVLFEIEDDKEEPQARTVPACFAQTHPEMVVA